jgi:Holliday junction DNA helicase RuvB
MQFNFGDKMETVDERFITSTKNESDAEIENKLRPTKIDDYVGQSKLKSQLDVFIKAALSRNEALDHVLLYGPPGLGKTTLSHIIANELGVQMKVTSGPAIESGADLASILTNLQKNDVLFIDEIHRLNKSVEEILYPAMEDYALDFVVGKGPSARAMRLKIQPFTLIGATTKAGNLSAPLRDRFGVIVRLENYTTEELQTIVKRSAKILGMELNEDASRELATRSRGTPRIANRLLKRVRDFAEVAGSNVITLDITKKALKVMEIDELGLDNTDMRIILTMIDRFGGKAVGLDTLAASTGEEATTIEDVYEPYLLQIGFIARTPRGRICLAKAYEHFGREIPESIKETIKDIKPQND